MSAMGTKAAWIIRNCNSCSGRTVISSVLKSAFNPPTVGPPLVAAGSLLESVCTVKPTTRCPSGAFKARSGDSQPTPNRVWYYIISVLRRLSKQRLRHPELSSGSLSDLDLIAQHLARGTPQEEGAYVNQLVSRMTHSTRQIFYWRLAGHSFRHNARELKAGHATIFRAYNKELRELILPRSFTRQAPPGSKPRRTAAKSTSIAGSSK